MDAHRKMLQRRQAYSGNPFQPTSTSVSTPANKPASTSSPSPSTTPNKPPTPSPSSTSSTPSSTSSSTSSSSSSLSSPSTSTSVTPVLPTLTTSTTSVRTSQRTSLPASSLTRPSLTSPTSTPSSTGNGGNVTSSGTNISTGAVIGGVAAAILGIAGIIFAVSYFIRRLKKKGDRNFDSDVFRRQSRMLQDEPQVFDDHSPFAPRPPSIIERRMNSTPVSSMGGNNYSPAPVHGRYNDYSAGYGHPGFPPAQVIPNHQPYADPRMPVSPMSPPMSPPMSANHRDVGAEQPQSAYLSRQPSNNGPAPADNTTHYVDLSRSSVTPFQAAQYEEIHRHLNMPPPAPVLGSLAEEEYPHKEPTPKGPSPFADPSEDVLPPPSPVHSNRSRVDSNPPRLPDLNPPMSPVYALHPAHAQVPSKQTEGSTADLPAAPVPAHVARPNPSTPNQRRDTVYTIYDDEDAYAGI